MKRRSLASRLVVLGVVQLVLLAIVAVAIFIAEGPHGEAYPEDALRRPMMERLEQAADGRGSPAAGSAAGGQRGVNDQPGELSRALDELRAARIEVSIYDPQRALIATNVEPPLAIPERHHPGEMPPGGPMLGGPPSPPGERDHFAWTAPNMLPPAPAPNTGGDDRALSDGARQHVMLRPLMMHGERGFLVARGVHGAGPGLIGPLLTFGCGLIVLVVGALIAARWIIRPIEQLTRTARSLGAGALSTRSRLRRDDEIGELGERLDEMAERIQGLLASEKELLANVAHELRTPLARIGVALDIAGEGDAAAARSSLEEIAVDVSELSTIVDDILAAMRFEVGAESSLPMRRARCLPSEIATAAADRMRIRHASRPFAMTVEPDLPEIDVDPVLFRRVIDNLLENAHKYSPDLDARIDLGVTRASGGAADDERGVVFEVRDHGQGISSDDLPRVFTAFFRGDRSRSRETGGVGLGLTLAKRIVEAHGGTIAVASAPDAGTIVRIAVPAS